MDFLEFAKERYSVRSFSQQPIEDEKNAEDPAGRAGGSDSIEFSATENLRFKE